MVLDMGAGAEGPVLGADPLEGFGSGLPMGLLTFLFTDIEGSTRLVQNIGTDQYGDLQAQHSHLLREAVAEHGGREFGSEGDAHFFVFQGAASAVRAAVQAQRRLGAYQWPPEAAIRVRMGLQGNLPSGTAITSAWNSTVLPGSLRPAMAARS